MSESANERRLDPLVRGIERLVRIYKHRESRERERYKRGVIKDLRQELETLLAANQPITGANALIRT